MMRDWPTSSGWTKTSLAVTVLALLLGGMLLHQHASGQRQKGNGVTSSRTQNASESIPSLTEEELAWLSEHPVIRVVQDPSWPPAEFDDEKGEPSGISNDYLNLIEQRLGVKFERIRGLTWQESYARLKRWDIDMTTCVAVTQERSKFWAFTKPYLNIPIVILTQADVTYVGNMRELNGRRVAVVTGYVSKEWIQRDYPEIELVSVNSVKEGMELLQRGDVFAFVDNMLVIGYYLARLKVVDLKIAGPTPYINAQCMAVRKDWAILAHIVDKALDSITDEERSQIYQKWVPIRYEHGMDYKLLWQVLALAGLIVGGLLLWNRKLSREIRYRQQAEAALVESERRYRDLWEKAPVMMISLDQQARINFASDRLCEELGHDREELLGKPPFVFQTNESARYAESVLFPQFLKTGVVKDAPLQLVRKNGQVIDVLLNVTAERNIEGKVVRSRSVFIDVTERKKAEHALREQERKYRLLAENTLDVIWQTDLDLRFTYVNPAVTRMTGYTVDEWIGSRLPEHCDKENFAKMAQAAQEEIAQGPSGSGIILEARMIRKTGEPFDVEIHGKVLFDDDGHPIALQGVTRDITERKKTEEALQESEQRYRAVFNIASVGIDVVDQQGRFLEANNTLSQILGYTREELRNLTILDVTHPEDAGKSRDLHESLIRGEMEGYRFEKRYVGKNGAIIWADTAVSAIREADGTHRATVGVIRDITQPKRSEQVRIRLAAAVEQAAEAIVITDTEGTIQYVNPAKERISGYSREELLGKNPRILKSGEHDEAFYRSLWATITAGDVWSGRLVNKRKDGRLSHEEATISPVKDDSGKIVNFVAVKRDITEHLELSNQLLQAQKMEAIGTLAGGVAHDFNNILQVALGYSEIMLEDENFPERYQVDLQKIYESAKRGAELVQRLLTFSRKTDIKPEPLDLNLRITELHKMLERTLPKMVDIKILQDAKLSKINADKTQIDQILMNLAVNARDAMPEGGKLMFETANVRLDEEYTRAHLGAKPGPYVLLTVTDTGSGMDKDTLEHIFEPFYTTKGVGEGTGLGLAMVHGIVKHHGGHIRCYSEPGKGTTFEVYFPALVSEEKDEETTERPVPKGGSETVLLVDDEEFIRDLGSRILTRAGYRVITASNGKEALEVYDQHGSDIDLVLLDLMMPEMGGKQCLEELLSLNPAVKVIIASGYAASSPTKEALEAGAKGGVNKPYDMRQMLEVVRLVLDSD